MARACSRRIRVMRNRFMSQHIAGGQFDPTAQAVMAQLKALPASPQEVPSLIFFEERVARAARRDVKRFQHHTTWCVFSFVVRCHVCNTFSLCKQLCA